MQKPNPDGLFHNSEQLFWSLQHMDSFFYSTQNVTIVFTMLLGQVSFPGRWRVVMHSQYLSMKGMISCGVGKKQKINTSAWPGHLSKTRGLAHTDLDLLITKIFHDIVVSAAGLVLLCMFAASKRSFCLCFFFLDILNSAKYVYSACC